MTSRHALVLAHRYSGLALAAVILLIAVTGVLTVFHGELDRVLNPALLGPTAGSGDPLPLTELVERATAAAGPGYSPGVIEFPLGESYPEQIRFPLSIYFPANSAEASPPYLYAIIDPFTGDVRGIRTTSLMDFLVELHIGTVAGRTGELVVGFASIFLLLMIVTGLVIWWPKPGKWRKALQLKRGSRLKVVLSLHNVAGAVFAVFLVLSAISGLYLVFPGQVRAVLLLPQPVEPTVVADLGGDSVSPDLILDRTRKILPHARITMLEFPNPERPFFRAHLFQPGEARQDGQTSLDFAVADGALLSATSPQDMGTRDRLLRLLRPIHTGEILGLPGRLMVLLAGLSLALMTVTGFLFWKWRPKAPQLRRARQSAQ